MADITMKEFAQAMDVAYVYGELADGSQVKIKKSNLLNKKEFYMEVNKEIDLGFNTSGILCIKAGNITATPAIVVAIANSTYFPEILNLNNVFVFGKEEPDKVCIYKTEGEGNIKVKNLTKVDSSLNISIL